MVHFAIRHRGAFRRTGYDLVGMLDEGNAWIFFMDETHGKLERKPRENRRWNDAQLNVAAIHIWL
ncbi:hypothetical protein DEA98_29150 (plasmid) [Brucella pseudogrignonensis]|nr:hypothetical protein [Brucella pseudogrignonensis]